MADKIDVLMFNMSEASDWESGIVNRNFFVLQSLLRDERVNRVLSIDFVPLRGARPFGLVRLVGYLLRHIRACHRWPRLWTRNDKWLSYSTPLAFISAQWFWRCVKKLVARHLDRRQLVIWLYNPFMTDALTEVSAPVKIFDMVDNWVSHPTYSSWQDELKTAYESIARQCDLVFTVSQKLASNYGVRPGVFWVPNGVDIENFQKALGHPVLSVIKKPIIGYVGTIQERVDLDLIQFLATNNPDKSFVLIGPVWRGIQKEVDDKFSALSNVHFLGRKPYNQLPEYLSQFDAAIIPHKLDDFTESNNPMKIYDYLAAGRQIVSTRIAGIEKFSGLIRVADTSEEFNRHLQEALVAPDDSDARKQIARENSWPVRTNFMLEKIYGVINSHSQL